MRPPPGSQAMPLQARRSAPLHSGSLVTSGKCSFCAQFAVEIHDLLKAEYIRVVKKKFLRLQLECGRRESYKEEVEGKKKALWLQKLNWEKEHPNQISVIKKSLGIPKEKLKKMLT